MPKFDTLLTPPGAVAGRPGFHGRLPYTQALLAKAGHDQFMLISNSHIVLPDRSVMSSQPGGGSALELPVREFAAALRGLEGVEVGHFLIYLDAALAALPLHQAASVEADILPVLAVDQVQLEALALPPGYALIPLRTALFQLDRAEHRLFNRLVQWSHWVLQTRYCEQCGGRLENAEKELALFCRSCVRPVYPRVAPCMIAAVYRPGELLLAQNVALKSRGLYSCVAGFVDPGESVEMTVHREVREETGVLLKSIRYIESEAWPFPHQLMLGFLAEYDSGEIVPEPGEIEDAQWFSIDDLPPIPPTLTISGRLIRLAVDELREQGRR
ncbi:NAD(+) diphosphatase [Allohahella marinimesophila]|uniref:NAD(+) diphosphatase n=1 Tax=Allohahella marinimesophila TaxID=1054972 RepID=A0ABP7NQC7_9GAMM